ncbi:glycosyl transferase family 2 [Candidatus Roizmanbacteria bacterium CG_4_9_14_0_2_um_filter_39_13]|uniref:Glycosyl transferase family 2 n=2 Tax=Candidatus Roizmaniibacteriota TaxID=1752723 RepID=A0A2M8F1C7_9BACT|nr:MAG: glycosyl transferase family 2 [Candidatus Roizmanbacteria bacterium CG_4_10_14_0_2_um_filter_39_12]PJC33085.1 MAG: glycosyl transferase family 2 [Candidatus Roizmanbacteria bacterium CG_4_9_14_0_2_um_filter_39_13]PJE61993.1 MAG: glycosyl transferase family 2 [Candidatus Roizmanbacteria bacterium CG10_big_fil_rev_8_21_14_0_10_39_12]
MKHKVIIVLPAYNAEKTLVKTLRAIPKGVADEIILNDDGSNDKTVQRAKKLGLTTFQHEINRGYGANQKSCYDLAISRHASIVVVLHPDFQYDPHLIPHLVDFIKDGYFDVMIGSRIRTRKEALSGGMPLYKYYSNRVLTFIQNLATGQNLGEWHSGLQAYSVEVIQSIPYETFSDDFIFATQMFFAAAKKGFRIGDIPIPSRYFKEASSINLKRGIQYGVLTLLETVKYIFTR